MRTKRVVDPNGMPTWTTDARGVLLDPSNRDLEAMAKAQPGLGAEYLDKRKQQLEQLEEREREAQYKEDFIERFLASGGTSRREAERAYAAHRNEQAAAAARAFEAGAAAYTRDHIRSAL